MPAGDIIVMGASAGGVEAYIELVAGLPADLPASVFIVLHFSPGGMSELPRILSNSGRLPAVHPTDGERIEPGRIYVAPPGHHMLIKPGSIRLLNGPRENRALPAIDPLFRSAARAYGRRVVGVILTGLLDDGAAGLETVDQLGGRTVVQDPDEALFPSMPLSAMSRVKVDHVLRLSEIPSLLIDLAHSEVGGDGERGSGEMKSEPDILELYTEDWGDRAAGVKPSAFSCPECGGILHRGGSGEYRCHVGHAFSLAHLEAAQINVLEEVLWSAVRLFNERAEVLFRLAARMKEKTARPLPPALRHRHERPWTMPGSSAKSF